MAQNEAVRSAKLQRLRMWQGKENKALRGGLVAMQCFFGEDGGVAGPVRGDSSNAQFFVDVVLGVDEYIRRLAGYLDEAGRGYGTLRLETSQGFAHSVGVRETGTYFEVTVPETSPYQLVAFAGLAPPAQRRTCGPVQYFCCCKRLTVGDTSVTIRGAQGNVRCRRRADM